MIGHMKNFAVGTDIESIGRFKKIDRIKDRFFLDKIFTEDELGYCFSGQKSASRLTARFSGKEAVIKALSSIGRNNISYKEIEIINDNSGVPRVKVNKANFNNLQIYLSLSHSKDNAIAFAAIMEVSRREK